VKTLMAMRHAKSDWAAPHDSDHDRPLNPRGLASAGHMGRMVAAIGLVPDLVVSSTAVRARTTAELAIAEGGWDCPLTLESGFYGTGPDTVLDVVSGLDEVGRLLVVGHQPTWGLLVRDLTGETVEMKTATVAVIELPIDDWSKVRLGGRLVGVHHPPR
jgi:phosphohistidine phosphatase